MSGYVLSRRARRDLQDIWQYTAKRWGRPQADRYTTEIAEVLQELSDGQRVPHAVELPHGASLRYPFASHAIFCRREADDRLRIIRILHQSMDAGRHLG